MQLSRNIIILVTITLLALNQAAKLRANQPSPATPNLDRHQFGNGVNKINNSDNPYMKAIPARIGDIKPDVVPAVVVIEVKPRPQVPITGAGYGNFSKTCSNYSFNSTKNELSASCKNSKGANESTKIKLNKCYVVGYNQHLSYRRFWNSTMDDYCKNCSVNLKTLFLTCSCQYGNTYKTRTTTVMNLNVHVKNDQGSLEC